MVSAIVVNMNGGRMLLDCVRSLVSQSPPPDEIIVVDNASSDGSDRLVQEEFPGIRLLGQRRNTGFAEGNNIGLMESRGDLIVLVNNDCVAEKGWLVSLRESVERDSVGAVASCMLSMSEPGTVDAAGGSMDWLGFAWDRGKGSPVSEFLEPCELAFPCGGAVMIRRSALPDPDRLFHEGLFAYQEDVELGFQLNRRGWKVVYDPGARIRHAHSATAGSGSFFKEHLCNRNRLIVLRRQFHPGIFERLRRPILEWQALWIIASLARGRWTLARAVLAGTRDGLREPVSHDPEGAPLTAVFARFAAQRSRGGPFRRYQDRARRAMGL
ncbi:glycosyltransferase family 2 protein [Candidatus Fermentibacterales bacterium]|nr:glycosyltransferase family 2 protein [Candidatus Fermentibacterales bacterium]